MLAVAQKIVSKAEGRLVNLEDVEPGEYARKLAEQVGKDPRLVELILRESEEVSRVRPGVIIVRHRLGFTSANAGIDRSNVGPGEAERVLLLPLDPDASAQRIRETLAGDVLTYEVMSPAPGAEPHFRYSDPWRRTVRIHTKLVKSEAA